MRHPLRNIVRESLLLVLSAVLLVPLYITVVNAFKSQADILANPISLPMGRLTLDNITYTAISSSFNIFKAYGTSLLITGGSVFLIITLGSMMAYMIARMNNRYMKVAYLSLLVGLLIPAQVILLPVVQLLSKIGLMYTPIGLILYNIGFYMPFTAFTYVGFIRTLSAELDESAKIDGASLFRTFWRIIFPLLRPITASIFIFSFLWIWNDFLNPQIILGSSKGYTVTTGIYRAIGEYSTNWNEIFALVLMASTPILLLYLFLQREFISGLTEGSLKG